MGLYLSKDLAAAQQTARLEERNKMMKQRSAERETACKTDATWLWGRARKCTGLLIAKNNQTAECKTNLQQHANAQKAGAKAIAMLLSAKNNLEKKVSKCHDEKVKANKVMMDGRACRLRHEKNMKSRKTQDLGGATFCK